MMIRSSLLSRIALACSSVFYSAQSSGLRHERCSAFIVGALSSASSNASRCPLALRSAHTLSAIVHTHSTTLPFGNGRSYGDSCLAASDHALHMRALDRFIAADWEKGLLIAEAGLTLEEIL